MSSREPREIGVTRHFHASPERVFAEWLAADAIGDWFVPETCTGLSAFADAREGGEWHVEYRSPSGQVFVEHGVYVEIVPHNRLVMTLVQFRDDPVSETTIEVRLVAEGAGTRMEFRQTGFESAARRDGNAAGWAGCFDKLSSRL